jgi:hypothetical protein
MFSNRFIRFNVPVIVWATFILILCSTPGNKIPHISWLELLSFDKFVHATVFFILNVLSIRSFKNISQLKKILGSIVCVFYGGILEVLQSVLFVGRSGDVLDFIANSFGVIFAFLVFKKLKERFTFLF